MATSGTITFASGEQTKTVTHTYGATPPNVLLESQVGSFAGIGVKIENKTETTFDVTLDSPIYGDSITYGWLILAAATGSGALSAFLYCTVAQILENTGFGYEEFGFSGDSELQTYIENVVTRASRFIDRQTQRPNYFFNGGATITEILDAKPEESSGTYNDTDRRAKAEQLRCEYKLRHQPVISVTSIAYNSASIGSADNYVAITAYRLDSETGRVQVNSASKPSTGILNLQFIYAAGYALTPDEIKWACEELVANALKKRLQDSLNSRVRFGRPSAISFGDKDVYTDAVKELIAPYKKVNL